MLFELCECTIRTYEIYFEESSIMTRKEKFIKLLYFAFILTVVIGLSVVQVYNTSAFTPEKVIANQTLLENRWVDNSHARELTFTSSGSTQVLISAEASRKFVISVGNEILKAEKIGQAVDFFFVEKEFTFEDFLSMRVEEGRSYITFEFSERVDIVEVLHPSETYVAAFKFFVASSPFQWLFFMVLYLLYIYKKPGPEPEESEEGKI